jgi:hypothetical protein
MSKLEKVGGVLLRENASVEVRFTSEIDIVGERTSVLEYTISGILFDEVASESLASLREVINDLSPKKTAVQGKSTAVQGRVRKGGAK